MLESEVCSSQILPPCREESGDEELSLLPRHTKVIVTGNNRTKSVLVGLQGVVKKAVGLGGWHWLVLKNGVEVKLQRNALSVLEAPTGNEEEDENSFCSSSDLGDKENDCFSSDYHKPNKPRVRPAKQWTFSTKSSNRNSYKEVQSSECKTQTMVNLAKLETEALWRYWKHFNLMGMHPNPSKEQLVYAVQRHFWSQQLDEIQVITGFIHAAKRLKTV